MLQGEIDFTSAALKHVSAKRIKRSLMAASRRLGNCESSLAAPNTEQLVGRSELLGASRGRPICASLLRCASDRLGGGLRSKRDWNSEQVPSASAFTCSNTEGWSVNEEVSRNESVQENVRQQYGVTLGQNR